MERGRPIEPLPFSVFPVCCSPTVRRPFSLKLKRLKGFAHLFRPTYPGFPVEVGGVVELHAAFLEESRTRGAV
jgi:hypothetical protein